jgi:hypothetical protein
MADGEKKYSLLLIVSLVVSGLILAGDLIFHRYENSYR